MDDRARQIDSRNNRGKINMALRKSEIAQGRSKKMNHERERRRSLVDERPHLSLLPETPKWRFWSRPRSSPGPLTEAGLEANIVIDCEDVVDSRTFEVAVVVANLVQITDASTEHVVTSRRPCP